MYIVCTVSSRKVMVDASRVEEKVGIKSSVWQYNAGYSKCFEYMVKHFNTKKNICLLFAHLLEKMKGVSHECSGTGLG